MLVKMKVKDDTFSGSREWIGSVEVALRLDYFCNVPISVMSSLGNLEDFSNCSFYNLCLPQVKIQLLRNYFPFLCFQG
jgi:hypothetical protein